MGAHYLRWNIEVAATVEVKYHDLPHSMADPAYIRNRIGNWIR
jgi:hypothetical protein